MSNLARRWVDKKAAAQRQLDAAIRLYFIEEDQLATYTVACAARTVLNDLMKRTHPDIPNARRRSLIAELWLLMCQRLIEDNVARGSLFDENHLARMLHTWETHAANFLKHADKNHGYELDLSLVMNMENIIAESCAWCDKLAFAHSDERWWFQRWLLAVRATQEEDFIRTKSGYVHEFDRYHQLEFGRHILNCIRAHNGLESLPEPYL